MECEICTLAKTTRPPPILEVAGIVSKRRLLRCLCCQKWETGILEHITCLSFYIYLKVSVIKTIYHLPQKLDALSPSSRTHIKIPSMMVPACELITWRQRQDNPRDVLASQPWIVGGLQTTMRHCLRGGGCCSRG